MTMKASKFKELLGDIPNAAEIVAEGIRKGELEDDGAVDTVFKSEVYTNLMKSLLDSVEKLQAIPAEAPDRGNDKATALKKSLAAENAPEMVSAMVNLEEIVKAVEKSQATGIDALAKGLIQVAKTNEASLRGFADLATQVHAISTKVNELYLAKSQPVEPAGTAATNVAVASPMDATAAAAANGANSASEFDAYAMEFDRANALIKGALATTPANDPNRRSALSKATVALMGGIKKPAELLAELGLK